ncbi:Putative amidase [Glycine soja]|nr:Putative amidase [Glycine soja]
MEGNLSREVSLKWIFLVSDSGPGNPKSIHIDDPGGSSSGSAISVAANLVAGSLGSETDGSILCPSGSNSVVGIKPTAGLTSIAGVVPITPLQDTVGPICRTVLDAALVLETIAGIDINDKATIKALKYVPRDGYAQFLKIDGLRGKRLGVVRAFYGFGNDTFKHDTFKLHLKTLRQKGAVLVDNLEINNIQEIFNDQSEDIAMAYEFKLSLNAYLEKLKEYGQDLMLVAQKTNGVRELKEAVLNMARLSHIGFEKLMITNNLDAMVVSFSFFASILARGGYPGVTVPAGYEKRAPFGIIFGGLKGSEPKLIQIAYSFEQATLIRKPPPLRKLEV